MHAFMERLVSFEKWKIDWCWSVLTGTYPLDVVRRRMQMKGATGELFNYNSTWHAFNVVVRIEGLGGLFKGMWPNLLKVWTMSDMNPRL